MMSKEDGKFINKKKNIRYKSFSIHFVYRQIALKALSERLKSTETTRHTQLPKSFPTVAVSGHGHAHSHGSQHQHKHHGSGHHHGTHGHGHSSGHGHSHSHASGGHGEIQTPPFLAQTSASSVSQPITTARSEPRMISTMSPIAIPMPAPPPKSSAVTSTENSAIATTEHIADSRDKALLIDMDNDNVVNQ